MPQLLCQVGSTFKTSFDIIYSSRVSGEPEKSLQGLPFFNNLELVKIAGFLKNRVTDFQCEVLLSKFNVIKSCFY